MRQNHFLAVLTLVAAVLGPAAAWGQVSTAFQPTGTADWNVGANWSDGLNMEIPDVQFSERAIINTGGTAFVNTNGPGNTGVISPNAILLGETSLGSGNLEIRAGGTLTTSSAGAWDGQVTVGGAGLGTLTVLPGGTFDAAGALTTGTNLANQVTVGGAGAGVANLSANSMTLNGTTRFFSNAAVTSRGALTFGGSSAVLAELGAPGAAPFQATGAANLGGSLQVGFTSTPTLGTSWPLIEAGSVAGSFGSVSSNLALAEGQTLALSTTSIAGDRVRLALDFAEVLVLDVSRDTGIAKIRQPGGSTITFDGYSILSSVGSLTAGTWNSLADQGALGGGWTESGPGPNDISELKAVGSGSLSTGQEVSLGQVYDSLAGTFGFLGEDLTFEYTTPDGQIRNGLVNLTGTRVNNLVLHVDPGTGEARLRNRSNTTVEIDAYQITSASGALNPTGWNSFDDQNSAGGEWLELLNVNSGQVGEVNPLEATTLGPNSSFELGSLFNTSGARDLSLQFLLADGFLASVGAVVYEPIVDVEGDFDGDGLVAGGDLLAWQRGFGAGPGASLAAGDANGDGFVNSVDFGIWENNFGGGGSAAAAAAAVPEPSTMGALLLVGLAVGGLRRR
jgi:hypothetical protein